MQIQDQRYFMVLSYFLKDVFYLNVIKIPEMARRLTLR